MSRLTNKGVDQTGLSSRDAAIDASFYLRCAVTAASATASQLTMHRRPTCHEYQWLVSAQCVGTRQPDTRQMSIVSTRIATRHKTTNWLAGRCGRTRQAEKMWRCRFFASKLSCSWFLRCYVVFWKPCVYGLYSADCRRLLVTSTSLWLLVSWWILSPVSSVQTVLRKTHRTRFYTSESRRTPQDGVVGVGVMECLAVLQCRWLDFSQISKTSTNLNRNPASPTDPTNHRPE